MLFSVYFLDQISSCTVSVLACVVLTFLYVGSLYVWRSTCTLSRDHPSTIKRRFFSVCCMMIFAPFFTKSFFNESTLSRGNVYDHLGLRWTGLVQASIYPLVLTIVLFLGPLTMQFISGTWRLYTEPRYWILSWKDLVWVRSHFMAPLSEEWVFRACMMPLMLQCYEASTAVFIGPLLFGIAHFHHMFELMRRGIDPLTAIVTATFQFTYTSMFGAYSSYLFVRTGHFAAPLVAHMFCNHMGFPNFREVGEYPTKQRMIIICNFLLGLVLWYFLLEPLTRPDLYGNTLWET